MRHSPPPPWRRRQDWMRTARRAAAAGPQGGNGAAKGVARATARPAVRRPAAPSQEATCSQEREIRSGKAAQVREDRGEVAVVHTEPRGERGEVLVAGRGGDPPAGAGVVGAIDRQGREL